MDTRWVQKNTLKKLPKPIVKTERESEARHPCTSGRSMVMTTAGVTRVRHSQTESKKKQNGYEMGSKKNTEEAPKPIVKTERESEARHQCTSGRYMVMTTAGVTRVRYSQTESKKKQNGYEMGSKKH